MTAVTPNLYGLDRDAIAALLAEHGARPFHADQLFRWLYRRDACDPAAWSDLPKPLRSRLASDVRIEVGRIGDRAEAGDGTVKYRIDLPGGGAVESVYMVQRDRVTLCVSSQVGCALDCDFCLTGRMGLVRHLTVGEILAQVALLRRDRQLGDRPINVVFMGMGEPLHNYDAVLSAFRTLTDHDGFGLSRRRVTISTSGLAPAIERLAAEPKRPRLAVSLNATTDEVRRRLMPITRRYPLARLLEACDRFAERSGERYTFEYVLLAGINDGIDDVTRLARIAGGRRAKINLIPFNAVEGWLDYRPPSRERVIAIRDRLLALGAPASIRWSRGADARAACGQLALLDPAAVQHRAPAQKGP